MTTQTQKTLHGLLSMLAAQCNHDADLIVRNQSAGIEALYLDLDYLDDLLAEIDEIKDAFTRNKRVKCH